MASSHIFEGLRVSAHSEFEYDAFYQLKRASGRVHQALQQHDYADNVRRQNQPSYWAKGTRHISLNNGAALERYTRRYDYDEAGNIKAITHRAVSQEWVKDIWTSPQSNRSLPQFDLNGLPVNDPESHFDANGNCTYLPHLRGITWNYRNNIANVVVIDRSEEALPNDEEYYVYGGDGIRVRKISQRLVDVEQGILERTEKIYLEDCEIKRIKRVSVGNQSESEILRRYTSKISDGNNIIAHIHFWEKDLRARETDQEGQTKTHFQLTNHLGSISLELDENGELITYEEYFPFGGSSFIAGRSEREINLKDYRYSGKERDHNTGLYYFGYRYYAHWIGGWMSPDPIGPEDAENLYLFVQNNPVKLVDVNGLSSEEQFQPDPNDIEPVWVRFKEIPEEIKKGRSKEELAAGISWINHESISDDDDIDIDEMQMVKLAKELGIRIYSYHPDVEPPDSSESTESKGNNGDQNGTGSSNVEETSEHQTDTQEANPPGAGNW